MFNRVKDKIIKLRESGKSYGEIAKLLNCSKGAVSYHCGIGQKEKTYNRNVLNKKKIVSKIRRKIQEFSLKRKEYIYPTSISKLSSKIRHKINEFSMKKDRTTYSTPLFTADQLLEKIGDKPTCYLSGKIIDINDSRSWSIDHKIPRSRGGNNTLDNAGICDSKINISKTDMTIDEFLEMCKSVLEYNGYKVIKDSSLPD